MITGRWLYTQSQERRKKWQLTLTVSPCSPSPLWKDMCCWRRNISLKNDKIYFLHACVHYSGISLHRGLKIGALQSPGASYQVFFCGDWVQCTAGHSVFIKTMLNIKYSPLLPLRSRPLLWEIFPLKVAEHLYYCWPINPKLAVCYHQVRETSDCNALGTSWAHALYWTLILGQQYCKSIYLILITFY